MTTFRPDVPAFTVATGLSSGFTRRELDGTLWARPFHGLRAVAGSIVDARQGAEAQRAAILLAAHRFSVYLSSHEYFSHTTAAVMWNIALPMLSDERIHVSVPAPHRAPQGKAVCGHQLAPHSVVVTKHPTLGIPVTSPAATWALLGSVLRHPYDLVAAADSIVRIDRMPGPGGRIVAPALATFGELSSAIPPGRRGALLLRAALPRVRGGVASRPETWTRLSIVDAGLPEPETDVDVYDDDGCFVGCADLAYRRERVAVEYEGDQHRTDPVQWQRDIEKHDRMAQLGWRVIRVTRSTLFTEPGRLTARVAAALRERA